MPTGVPPELVPEVVLNRAVRSRRPRPFRTSGECRCRWRRSRRRWRWQASASGGLPGARRPNVGAGLPGSQAGNQVIFAVYGSCVVSECLGGRRRPASRSAALPLKRPSPLLRLFQDETNLQYKRRPCKFIAVRKKSAINVGRGRYSLRRATSTVGLPFSITRRVSLSAQRSVKPTNRLCLGANSRCGRVP